MMMTMTAFNKQQHISMVSTQTVAAVRVQVTSETKQLFTGLWMVLTAVTLVSYWVSEQQKICAQYQYYPIPVNTAQYPITQYEYHSNHNDYTSKICTKFSLKTT